MAWKGIFAVCRFFDIYVKSAIHNKYGWCEQKIWQTSDSVPKRYDPHPDEMKTILLVDDDQQVRALFGLALRRNGYCVIEAESGVAGLEMARRHLPDLILSDVLMPAGNGSILLRDIRRDSVLSSTQIVLMTGSPDLVKPGKDTEGRADDFLVKPVGLQELLSCVKGRFSQSA